ncbi:MAG: hypothetical protein ACOY4F_07695 [Thermodesulfobacteriota bacterium]
MKTIALDRADSYVRFRWWYLSRNPGVAPLLCRAQDDLRAAWEKYRADPTTELPEGVTASLRRDVGVDDDGRPCTGDELFVTLRREVIPFSMWIKIGEDGQIESGPVVGGLWYQGVPFDVRDFAVGSSPARFAIVDNSGLSDSIKVEGYPEGPEREIAVKIKLARPLNEIVIDLKHLRALFLQTKDGPAREEVIAAALPPDARFRVKDAQRAAGLWLFDQTQAGLSQAEALREFFRAGLDHLLFQNIPDERSLRRYLENARRCVSVGEVLPI